MPDIHLRIGHDVLVLSTPIDHFMASQGFTEPSDREYIALCEPELIEESYKLENIIGTPCFCTATEGITRARLAHARFENQAEEMARIAYETAAQFKPQHVIAVVGPTGLPLDETSAVSMKANKAQYQDAMRALAKFPYDAVFLSGFSNAYDAQCALMGVRAVYDGPLFCSFAVNGEGELLKGTHSAADAAALAAEYGADVVGISTAASVEKIKAIIAQLKDATEKPLLVDFEVGTVNKRQMYATEENPYYIPDTLVDASIILRNEGVAFFRASGNATPSYTGALVAAVSGLPVVR